jgi:hypothetical protein
VSDPRDTQQSRQRCTCSSTDMRQCENDAVYRGQGKFGFLLACEGHVPYLLVQIGQVEKLAAQPSDGPALPYEKCGQLLRTVGDKTLTCSRRKRHGGFCNNYMDSPESVAPRPPAPSEPDSFLLEHFRSLVWRMNGKPVRFYGDHAGREIKVSEEEVQFFNQALRDADERAKGEPTDAENLVTETRPAPRVEAPAPLPSSNCTTCGAVTNPMRSCDVTMGTYCINCWPKTACAKGKHDEGCETLIASDTEPSAAPSPTALNKDSGDSSPLTSDKSAAFWTSAPISPEASSTAAEGERGQYEDCSQSPDRTPNFAPADRGAVQTALPRQVAENIVRLNVADDLIELHFPGVSPFFIFNEDLDEEEWKIKREHLVQGLTNTLSAPAPLSAEELAPLLAAKMFYADRKMLREIAEDMCSLPGVAVVRE